MDYVMDYRRDVARMVLAQVKASEGEVQSGRQDSSTKTWGVPLARPRPRTLRLLPGLLLPSSSLLPPSSLHSQPCLSSTFSQTSTASYCTPWRTHLLAADSLFISTGPVLP